jgi:Flp pilus assembly protein TadG
MSLLLGPRSGHLSRGQSLTEFALVLPLLLLLVVAVADFGRLYTSLIAVESAAREAADYGAMQGKTKWDMTNSSQLSQNQADMRVRACTATASLTDYVGDPIGTTNMSCTNPTFAYTADVDQPPSSGNCSTQAEFDDPCIIHVTLTYTFHPLINIAPFPASLTFTRESSYAISDLGS